MIFRGDPQLSVGDTNGILCVPLLLEVPELRETVLPRIGELVAPDIGQLAAAELILP
jgi:hypothetical protein